MTDRDISVVGSWEVTVGTPMGAQVVSLEFTDEHSGVARYGADAVPLQNVSVSGNSVTCTIKLTQPMALTLTCAVTVDGADLTGSASVGFLGTFALTGRRTSV